MRINLFVCLLFISDYSFGYIVIFIFELLNQIGS